MAGYIKSDNSKSPYSKGCITIPVQDYLEFGVNVGFIKGEAVDDIGEIWETYDDKDKYLKFNGSRSEE